MLYHTEHTGPQHLAACKLIQHQYKHHRSQKNSFDHLIERSLPPLFHILEREMDVVETLQYQHPSFLSLFWQTK